MELPEELANKIKSKVEREVNDAAALSQIPGGLFYFTDARYAADRSAKYAAKIALKWATEEVCSYCGGKPDDNSFCPQIRSRHAEIRSTITRAEWLRKKEGR